MTRENLFIKDLNKSSSEADNSSTSGDKDKARRSISNQGNFAVQDMTDELSQIFVHRETIQKKESSKKKMIKTFDNEYTSH